MNLLNVRSFQLSRQIVSKLQAGRASQTVKPLPSRLYASSSSNPAPEKTPHTPETYQKDETVSEPSSSRTHVVSGQPDGDARTQRPFEGPSGSYTTTNSSKPYDEPAKDLQEEQSKSTYGSLNRGGGGSKDVHGDSGPQTQGKEGRQ